jgi:hypothetical protein
MRWVAVLAVVLLMGCPRHEEPPGGGGGQLASTPASDPARYHADVARAAGAASMLVDALQRGNTQGALRYLGQARTQLYDAERYAGEADRRALIEAQDQAIMVQARLADRAAATSAAQGLLSRLSAIQAAYRATPSRVVPPTAAPQARTSPVRPQANVPTPRPTQPGKTAGTTVHRPTTPPYLRPVTPGHATQATPRGWSGMVPQPQFAPSTTP